MKKSEVFLKIQEIIKDIDDLNYKFFDDENSEDFLSEIESAVCALDELEDIIERDEAYRKLKEENK
jgi:hypothetical protein